MPRRTLLSFLVAILVAVAFLFIDHLVLDDIIPNRGPRWTPYDFVKAALAAGLAMAMVVSVLSDGPELPDARAPAVARPGPVILNYGLAVAFVLLFLISPVAFNWLSLEDNVVEYGSALFCLAGAAFFVSAAWAIHRSAERTGRRRAALWVALLGAVGLFLIGMEEISWFQRVLGFGTPESFAANRQGEVNLHNFATTPVTSLYRIGSWAVLVLLPFVVAFGPRLRLFDTLREFLPPAWVAAMSAPVACFTYSAWPFLPTQVIFFASLLIFGTFLARARQAGQHESALIWASGLALLIGAQTVFLLGGEQFVRHWDVTEFQEFFMAFGLAATAWSAWERIRARRQPSQPEVQASGQAARARAAHDRG
jgi:hypothetical protein